MLENLLSMDVPRVVFYLLSAVLLFSATMVATNRKPVRAALFLVLAFFASAGLWLLLEAEFLSLILLLVYVGAVMTLFLFVVMMLNLAEDKAKRDLISYFLFGLFVLVALLALMLMAVGPEHFGVSHYVAPLRHAADYSNVSEFGVELFNHYFYAVEISGVLLLVAMVAAITLSFRGRRDTKRSYPGDQIKVRREDRVRIVKMAAEQRPHQ